jgi:hypothetical protein
MSIKNGSKKHLYALLAIIIISLVYLLLFKSGIQIRKVWFSSPMKVSVLVHGNDNISTGNLDFFLIYFDRKSKLIKILSVNTNMRTSPQRASLRQSFNNDAKKSIDIAVKNFYKSCESIFGKNIAADYFIETDYETLSTFLISKGKISDLLLKVKFTNADDKALTQLKTAELFLSRFSSMPLIAAISIMNNYSLVKTDLSRLFFLNFTAYLALYKNVIFFCDLPIRKAGSGLALSQEDLSFFFDHIFFESIDESGGRLDGFIEVKNASIKTGAAQEAAWVLRENGLDVLDYSNSAVLSDETIIKDYKGNFLQTQAIAKYLKVGKIIVSYDSHYHYDTTVLLGADYKLKGAKTNNGKN